MARRIPGAYISCGSCAGECPAGVISRKDTQYVIDEPGCIDYGVCEAVYPVGAISEVN